MAIFKKVKHGKERHIYILGRKVYSYTRNIQEPIPPTFDMQNALYRETFWNAENKYLVNLAKQKDYIALISHLINQDAPQISAISGGDPYKILHK